MPNDADPTIQCPRCQTPMRKLEVDETIIDRCDKCFGIWLDKGELLKLIADKRRADPIDIGEPVERPDPPFDDELLCPRDGAVLGRRRHADQRHIPFAYCLECGGRFFDAGKLRDLSRLSISDVVKHVLGL